jgi:hypothetical protein
LVACSFPPCECVVNKNNFCANQTASTIYIPVLTAGDGDQLMRSD